MKAKFLRAMLVVSTLALGGCGSEHSGGTGMPQENGDPGGACPSAESLRTVPLPVLAGTWSSLCHSAGDGAIAGYTYSVMQLTTTGSLVMKEFFYDDAACLQKRVFQRISTGLYSTNAKRTALTIDFGRGGWLSETPLSDAMAQRMNQNRECGYANWARGVSQACTPPNLGLMLSYAPSRTTEGLNVNIKQDQFCSRAFRMTR